MSTKPTTLCLLTALALTLLAASSACAASDDAADGATPPPGAQPPPPLPEAPPPTLNCDGVVDDHTNPIASLIAETNRAADANIPQPGTVGSLLHECYVESDPALAIQIWTETPNQANSIGVAVLRIDGKEFRVFAPVFRGIYGGTTFLDDVAQVDVGCGEFGLTVNDSEDYAFFMDRQGAAEETVICTPAPAAEN